MRICVVCSWCGRFIRFKEDENHYPEDTEERISHGICAECKAKVLEEIDSAPAENTKPNK